MKHKNLALLFDDSKTLYKNDPRGLKFFKKPYSEFDILELQNIFLTKGFHYIKTPSIEQGRTMILLFLESLHYYYAPACFTNNDAELHGAINIYKSIQNGNKEMFFYDNFFIDFMWIEISEKKGTQKAIYDFYNTCELLQLENRMPIVILYS